MHSLVSLVQPILILVAIIFSSPQGNRKKLEFFENEFLWNFLIFDIKTGLKVRNFYDAFLRSIFGKNSESDVPQTGISLSEGSIFYSNILRIHDRKKMVNTSTFSRKPFQQNFQIQHFEPYLTSEFGPLVCQIDYFSLHENTWKHSKQKIGHSSSRFTRAIRIHKTTWPDYHKNS